MSSGCSTISAGLGRSGEIRIERAERATNRLHHDVAAGAALIGRPVSDLAVEREQVGARRRDRVAEQRAPDELAAEDGTAAGIGVAGRVGEELLAE